MNFTARLAGVAAALCLSFGAVAADNGTQVRWGWKFVQENLSLIHI